MTELSNPSPGYQPRLNSKTRIDCTELRSVAGVRNPIILRWSCNPACTPTGKDNATATAWLDSVSPVVTPCSIAEHEHLSLVGLVDEPEPRVGAQVLGDSEEI